MWSKESVLSVLRKRSVIAGGSICVSTAFTAVLSARYYRLKYEAIADEEIKAFKSEWPALYERQQEEKAIAQKNEEMKAALVQSSTSEPEPIDPATLREDEELRQKVNYGKASTTPEAPVTVIERNLFADHAVEFDYDAEIPKRDASRPYVISVDEWSENEQDYIQAELTYYRGDDTLADDQDMVVADVQEAVGVDNLSQFGYGSRDPHVVYVRNDLREIEFEITLSEGKYAHEVAGLQHMDAEPARRRMRDRPREEA